MDFLENMNFSCQLQFVGIPAKIGPFLFVRALENEKFEKFEKLSPEVLPKRINVQYSLSYRSSKKTVAAFTLFIGTSEGKKKWGANTRIPIVLVLAPKGFILRLQHDQ